MVSADPTWRRHLWVAAGRRHRAALRLALFLGMFFIYTLGSWPAARRRAGESETAALRRRLLRACRWCRLGCRLFALRPHLHSQGHPGAGCLVIANHFGYLDPVALLAAMPAAFVTSTEMRDTPLLGTIAKGAGCVFVERRDRRRAEADMVMVAGLLEAGLPVVVYPEGTSSDGSGVLPFKPPLLQAALRAGRPLLPLVARFTAVDRVRPDRRARDRVCWYGDMTFLPHVWSFFALDRVDVAYQPLARLVPDPGEDRKALARRAHALVAAAYTAA